MALLPQQVSWWTACNGREDYGLGSIPFDATNLTFVKTIRTKKDGEE